LLKVMAFLVKRPEISLPKLIDYYENHHVPLILSLAPAPTTYKRNFITRPPHESRRDDVDIITELTFSDRAVYRSWVSAMYAPGSGVAEDEGRFLDRARTRSYAVEEHVTRSSSTD
jgi:hypothetical protein